MSRKLEIVPDPVMCICGEELHYKTKANQLYIESCVAQFGECVKITTPWGSWLVPRHYIALHGLAAMELPLLARKYKFEKVDG